MVRMSLPNRGMGHAIIKEAGKGSSGQRAGGFAVNTHVRGLGRIKGP